MTQPNKQKYRELEKENKILRNLVVNLLPLISEQIERNKSFEKRCNSLISNFEMQQRLR